MKPRIIIEKKVKTDCYWPGLFEFEIQNGPLKIVNVTSLITRLVINEGYKTSWLTFQ